MGKIRAFFYSFFRSLTSLSYYGDVLQAKFSFSIKVYLIYWVIFSLVTAGFFYLMMLKYVSPVLDSVPEALMEVYPDEMVITVEDGVLSTNVDEPYVVSIDEVGELFEGFGETVEEKVKGVSTEDMVNILVIDTQATYDDYEGYKTAALLTDSEFIMLDDNGSVQLIPLGEVDNLVINRAMVDELIESVEVIMSWAMPVVLVLVSISIMIIYPIIKGIYLLFYALLGVILIKIMKFDVSYKKVYQIGMHQLMLVEIILAFWVVLPVETFFMQRTLMMLMFLGLIVWKLKGEGVGEKMEVPKPAKKTGGKIGISN